MPRLYKLDLEADFLRPSPTSKPLNQAVDDLNFVVDP